MNIQIIKNSFQKVKRDFDVLRLTLSDWVTYLMHRDSHLENRIRALEARVAELEAENKVILTY